ncbi:MAG: hypothetical protein ABA06_00030 [Parcubacteria bacterium C7867-001]|nr:MAG: hypothetical protein ABA06_00030 [Parcubacteria bacterium C7867-001]
MRSSVAAVLCALAVAGIIAAVYFLPRPTVENSAAKTPFATSTLSAVYTNSTYHFSVSVPEGFTSQELQDPENGQTVVLQGASGDGIQIVIQPFGEDLHVLTEERIRHDIPDMSVKNAQPVTVGTDYTGLAFLSDNAAFGGASREVWFVFRGTLYQISTYERLDGLLKAMFATWKFQE